MIERSLDAKRIKAGNEGFRQRILTHWLQLNLKAAKALGFGDVNLSEVENPVGEREQYFWNQQIDRLIRRGFHAAIDMSEVNYRASMPTFQPQPEQFKGRFNIPILVDPRPNLQTQLRLFNVYTHQVTEAELTQAALAEHLRQLNNEGPYQIWIRNNGWVRGTDKFEWDESGLTISEALAVVRENPEIFKEIHPEGIIHLNCTESKLLSGDTQTSWTLDLEKHVKYDHLYLNANRMTYFDSPITKGKLYSS